MPDYRSEGDVTPSGAVILWNEQERKTPENRMTVFVRYPCCHRVYERDVHSRRRFRAQGAAGTTGDGRDHLGGCGYHG